MGNWLPRCLKASPSPSASPKLGWSSRQVKCESEVHEEAARDTRAMEAVPVTPKSEKLNLGAIKHCHLKNIRAPMTPQEQDKRKKNEHELITQADMLKDPEQHVVYRFVCSLFSAEHLTAECAIVALIYVERIMRYAVIDLCPTNWKRLLLGAAIVAYELWDKQALWDVPYCRLINNIITAEDM
uniref:Cyclin N-terminal domain-containing protein n=1 Tax=Pipistrellus kuhlii TaxID=59472 RepID=A0A7J7TAU8_PIPKU|nr:hypothetical protein mPipKuh1_009685 [Pipistrellus kuhlii]